METYVLDTRDNDTETGPWSLQLNSFEIIRMKGEGGKKIFKIDVFS